MSKLIADVPSSVIGTIAPPDAIKPLVNLGGSGGVNKVLKDGVILLYQIAFVLFIFMILFSALQWITSGGEKEKVAAARGRLTNAIIGLVILGLAGVITTFLGQITGFK